MNVVLNQAEMDELFLQDPNTAPKGGWQGLLVSLQKKTDRQTGSLNLTVLDLERIQKYAFYDQGTFETRLQRIFGRVLGPKLDRNLQST